jgi:hypothetical protein
MKDEILNPVNSSGDPGQGRNRGRGSPSAKCCRLVKALLSLERLRMVASTCFRPCAARLAVDESPAMDGSKPWMGSGMGGGDVAIGTVVSLAVPTAADGCRSMALVRSRCGRCGGDSPWPKATGMRSEG